MKLLVLFLIVLPSFTLGNTPRQKREFVPIIPVNISIPQKEKSNSNKIVLPKKDPNKDSKPDASLFPTPILNFD